jgi:N-methylhydantoinase A
VPRYLRLPARGRIDREGREIEPLEEADIAAAAAVFRDEAVEAVAICLMNSYLDGRHEAQAADRLREALPHVHVTRSAEVASVMGEYERGSTAVLDAYVAPRTVSYLTALNARLAELGLRVPLLLIQNNGGAVSVDEIAGRPSSLLLSGPAAGVGALSYFAQALGSSDLVSMEIGGTSCDVILMDGGKVAFSDRLDIGGYVCMSPAVEVHTIGAGGGTIARVDGAGMLQIGPDGAGARPGPACYGFGGSEATITDAQLVLGRVRSGPIADGSVVLDPVKAAAAIGERIARPLGLSVEAAAIGMIRLMDQKLLHAVQRLSSERGHDPRRFALVAAGGAGPLHGAAVGRALGTRRVFMPRLAGAFCALGMLHADMRHDYSRVHLADLDDADPEAIGRIFAELENEARQTLARERFSADETSFVRAMDMRYVGQQWDISVPVAPGLDPAAIRRDFEAEHDRLFGHVQPQGPIEITKLRAAGIGRLPPLRHRSLERAGAAPRPVATRRAWIGTADGWRDTPVYDPAGLRAGHEILGPALVDEATTTVLVGAGDRLAIDASGNYVVAIAEGRHG